VNNRETSRRLRFGPCRHRAAHQTLAILHARKISASAKAAQTNTAGESSRAGGCVKTGFAAEGAAGTERMKLR